MVAKAKEHAEQVTRENDDLKAALKSSQMYIKWLVDATDFSSLTSQNLDTWQQIYARGLREIAVEKGKREAFAEYRSLQAEFKHIYALNHTLQERLNLFKDNICTESVLELTVSADAHKPSLEDRVQSQYRSLHEEIQVLPNASKPVEPLEVKQLGPKEEDKQR